MIARLLPVGVGLALVIVASSPAAAAAERTEFEVVTSKAVYQSTDGVQIDTTAAFVISRDSLKNIPWSGVGLGLAIGGLALPVYFRRGGHSRGHQGRSGCRRRRRHLRRNHQSRSAEGYRRRARKISFRRCAWSRHPVWRHSTRLGAAFGPPESSLGGVCQAAPPRSVVAEHSSGLPPEARDVWRHRALGGAASLFRTGCSFDADGRARRTTADLVGDAGSSGSTGGGGCSFQWSPVGSFTPTYDPGCRRPLESSIVVESAAPVQAVLAAAAEAVTLQVSAAAPAEWFAAGVKITPVSDTQVTVTQSTRSTDSSQSTGPMPERSFKHGPTKIELTGDFGGFRLQ